MLCDWYASNAECKVSSTTEQSSTSLLTDVIVLIEKLDNPVHGMLVLLTITPGAD